MLRSASVPGLSFENHTGPIPATSERREGKFWTVSQFITGPHTHIYSHGKLQSSINQWNMRLDCGRKRLENMQTAYRKDFRDLNRADSANHYTTDPVESVFRFRFV